MLLGRLLFLADAMVVILFWLLRRTHAVTTFLPTDFRRSVVDLGCGGLTMTMHIVLPDRTVPYARLVRTKASYISCIDVRILYRIKFKFIESRYICRLVYRDGWQGYQPQDHN